MASADLPRVLRIPRIGGTEDDFILLHVSSTIRHPLDLKLIGTDGEEVYSLEGKVATASTRSGGPRTSNFMR
jgi:hypothetical protein